MGESFFEVWVGGWGVGDDKLSAVGVMLIGSEVRTGCVMMIVPADSLGFSIFVVMFIFPRFQSRP